MTNLIAQTRIEAAHEAIDPVFKNSPQFAGEPLSAQLGCRTVLKLETANPIRCFKGRGADWWMGSQAGMSSVVCASAGNFGQAIAYCARKHAIEAHVFAASNANPLKIAAMQALGATVHVGGADLDAAKETAIAFAAESGRTFVEDGKEDMISEGAGTIALELSLLPKAPDAIYIPVGNGALVNGMGSWIKSAMPNTRVVAVCATGAPSMKLSWETGELVTTDKVDTIADGIAVRVPVPESLPPLAEVVDEFVEIDDQQMIEAGRLLFQLENLVSEPAGIAGLAALIDNAERHSGQTVATVICGSNIDPARKAEWLLG